MKKILAIVLSLCMLLGSVALAETTDGSIYTLNRSLTTFPTNWNPHQYKTATDNDAMMVFLSDAFYNFDYNAEMDGYDMPMGMIVSDPEDVTADYVGETWGIPEGAVGRAWKYTLRDDLKWQDGTPITAQTFVESAKQQLNPQAQNYRADSLYSGSFVVHNAEGYVKQAGGLPSSMSLGAYMEVTGFKGDIEGFLAAHGEEKGYIDWNFAYGDTYDFETQTWLGAAEDGVVETPLTIAELYAFYTTGAGSDYCTWADAATKLEWVMDETYGQYVYPDMDFEQVGVQAVSDTEVVFIMDKTLQGFQLKYNLSIHLIHPELYEACASVVDGVYTNSYGTSAETTMSYGPYMLTSFQSDKEYVLEKNPNWYGYSLPENEGLYQATRIVYNSVPDAETRFNMFENGQLDTIILDADHLADYLTSEYTYLTESPSVFSMAFNPDMAALTANQEAAGENINKTILTVKEFRQAMSYGIDRNAFVEATVPGSAAAFALYGNTIVGDPDKMEFYRDSEEAKQVMVDFWGLTDEVGEGKLYADNDAAIDSITGYSLEQAREYFNKAYDIALEQGLMDADDVIEIMIGIPNATSAAYNNGYDFIVNNYTDAVKGTSLEGKLTFKKDDTLGNAFGDALRNNRVDMLFLVGWSGAEFDPYSLMEAYVSSNYQYDRAWDTTTAEVTIELDGESYTTDVYSWYEIINDTPHDVAKADGTKATLRLPYSSDPELAHQRLQVLAALENAVLQNYNFIPLTNDAAPFLKGMKIEFPLEEEIFPMQLTNVKYITFNYDDAAWAAFVTEQGGTLNYK